MGRGKRHPTAGAGDEIFDSRTISALRAQGHVVSTLHPARVGTPREIANSLMGIPHYRARFWSRRNRALLEQAGAGPGRDDLLMGAA